MWIVEIDNQGYISYQIFKNKPIVQETYPTERTCRTEVVNYEQAGYLTSVDEDFVDRLPFTVSSGYPVEFDITSLDDKNLKNNEDKVGDNPFYHHMLFMSGPYVEEKIDQLRGKCLKDIGIYSNDDNVRENQILFLFDDNTYVDLGIEVNPLTDQISFKNRTEYVVDINKNDINENPTKYGYVDRYNKFNILPKYSNYVKFGMLKYSDDAAALAVKESEQNKEDKEYEEYLRLEKKFKNRKNDSNRVN